MNSTARSSCPAPREENSRGAVAAGAVGTGPGHATSRGAGAAGAAAGGAERLRQPPRQGTEGSPHRGAPAGGDGCGWLWLCVFLIVVGFVGCCWEPLDLRMAGVEVSHATKPPLEVELTSQLAVANNTG